MSILHSILALLAGVALPLQIGLNTMIAKVSTPLWSSAFSFLIGTMVMFLVVLVFKNPIPAISVLKSLPGYVWLGGVLGAFYVTATIIVAPKIGAAALVSLVVTGQLIAALILDHYGFANFPQQDISLGKIAGALLLISGVILIKKY
jgi:bacterial/archaeal transporter family-2 protein